ncbi:MAG: hypothetical protein FJ385_06420 [Verrucomicrobia bacterium]|nr:hypothetical protein [Verrucomicrobiota bacterium]
MKPSRILPLLAALLAATLVSCATDTEKKPVGPQSDNSRISWTGQTTSPIQGQFGMMPQNQYRR